MFGYNDKNNNIETIHGVVVNIFCGFVSEQVCAPTEPRSVYAVHITVLCLCALLKLNMPAHSMDILSHTEQKQMI